MDVGYCVAHKVHCIVAAKAEDFSDDSTYLLPQEMKGQLHLKHAGDVQSESSTMHTALGNTRFGFCRSVN